MCLACQMEADWLAYLEHLAQQELPSDPASEVEEASPRKAAVESNATPTPTPAPKSMPESTPKPGPTSPFVCEEPPSE